MKEEDDQGSTRAERRERKRKRAREMGVSGRSVRQLQDIIRRKADEARRREE